MFTRKLNTDYLDDVSSEYADVTAYDGFTNAKRDLALKLRARQQELDNTFIPPNAGDQRGNPKNKDAYFTFNIKIGYTFGREKR